MLEKLFRAGADAFRVNMSHGGSRHPRRKRSPRSARWKKKVNRPITILCDLQGPKLRVGTFREGRAVIRHSATSPWTAIPNRATRRASCLPHPELFGILEKGQRLLIDDGKVKVASDPRREGRDHGRHDQGHRGGPRDFRTTRASTCPMRGGATVPALSEKDEARPAPSGPASIGADLDRPVVRAVTRRTCPSGPTSSWLRRAGVPIIAKIEKPAGRFRPPRRDRRRVPTASWWRAAIWAWS